MVEPWHLHQIVDDPLRSQILVPQDSLGIDVAQRDDIDVVDLGDVGTVQDQIVEVLTSNLLGLDQGLWQEPLLRLKSDRVAGRDLEAIG